MLFAMNWLAEIRQLFREWVLPGFAVGFTVMVLGFLVALFTLGDQGANSVWNMRHYIFLIAYVVCLVYNILRSGNEKRQ
jgi:ABC-type spermidine/putrescine transport system permease subunit II